MDCLHVDHGRADDDQLDLRDGAQSQSQNGTAADEGEGNDQQKEAPPRADDYHGAGGRRVDDNDAHGDG